MFIVQYDTEKMHSSKLPMIFHRIIFSAALMRASPQPYTAENEVLGGMAELKGKVFKQQPAH